MVSREANVLVVYGSGHGRTILEQLDRRDLVSDLKIAQFFTSVREQALLKRNLLVPPLLWSGRISSGLFGTKECPSGRRGPGGKYEIAYGVGTEGLAGLIDLGFLPCPSCRDRWRDDFPTKEMIGVVQEKYGLGPDELFDPHTLPFDGRRVDHERITATTGSLPNRIYVPEGLLDGSVLKMWERFSPLPRRQEVTVGSYRRGGINAYFTLPAGPQEE